MTSVHEDDKILRERFTGYYLRWKFYMRFLIGIDDTDSPQTGGTGGLAFQLGRLLQERTGARLLEVTHHQLWRTPLIPCTRATPVPAWFWTAKPACAECWNWNAAPSCCTSLQQGKRGHGTG